MWVFALGCIYPCQVSSMCIWRLKTAACLGTMALYHLSPPFPATFQSWFLKKKKHLHLSHWVHRDWSTQQIGHIFPVTNCILLCFYSYLLLSSTSFAPLIVPLSSDLFIPPTYILPFSCLPLHLSPRHGSHSSAVFSQCLLWTIYMGCPSLDPDTQPAPPSSAVKVRPDYRLEVSSSEVRNNHRLWDC